MTLPKGYKKKKEEPESPGPIKSKKLHVPSTRGATIFAVILFLLLVGGIAAFFFWAYFDMWGRAEEKMDRGCVPTGTSNQYGIPTTFSCPRR